MRFTQFLAMDVNKKIDFWRKVLSATNYTNKTRGNLCHILINCFHFNKPESLEKLVCWIKMIKDDKILNIIWKTRRNMIKQITCGLQLAWLHMGNTEN